MTVPEQQKSGLSRDVGQDAQQAVTQLAKRSGQNAGFGSFSISIYDTAWLAMIQSPNEPCHWLFPESFSYLLLHQNDDGMWPTYASPIDGILNTLAGLLALVRHHASDSISAEKLLASSVLDLPTRIERARRSLESALRHWNVSETLHVGFEVLVPSLLSQLSREGVVFPDFEGRAALMALHQEKLSRFRPTMVSSPTTLLHSVEALVGVVDHGLLRHHCTEYGGMLGSPASTAAYLMNTPAWDTRAEAYLRNVVRSYGSCGGVPSGFPTPVFEISWIMSTLLACDFHVEDFARGDIESITSYLLSAINSHNGVLGFAPPFLPDADDTSRTLLALTFLGVHVDRTPLIQDFEGISHFKTYRLERDPSASANCNVLLALLASSTVDSHAPQIEKAVRFLCSCWNANRLQDKWNLAPEYTNMLLASAFSQLLSVYDQGSLQSIATDVIKLEAPIILLQLLGRSLRTQQENGSWSDSVERTAYGALLVYHAFQLPWPTHIHRLAETSLAKAKAYLMAHSSKWATGEYLWVEKVTYKVPPLSEAYCLAAMRTSTRKQLWSHDMHQAFSFDQIKIKKMSNFFGQLPLLQDLPKESLTMAICEATLYASRLKKIRLDIFPRDDMKMSADKYLEYIPIAWTTINAADDLVLSGEEMWDMMVVSMLNYQADEFMESVVAHLDGADLHILKTVLGAEIRNGCRESYSSGSLLPPSSPQDPVPSPMSDSWSSSHSSAIDDILQVLLKFIRYVKGHKAFLRGPELAQLHVMQELDKFLAAHIAHNADNARLKTQQSGGPAMAVVPYYDWVHSTGANDTSCPYSFAFFCCLISRDDSHCLVSLDQRYLAREMCSHLAVLCRQFNDYGSAARDDAEGNLNSLHFPQFVGEVRETPGLSPPETSKGVRDGVAGKSLPEAKAVLMKLASVERACMQVCWELLSSSLDKDTSGKIRAFIDVTELFGQIYVARDIASNVQK